jgi:hypothetical protein
LHFGVERECSMQQGLRPHLQDENAMALHHPLHLKAGGGGADDISGALRKGTPNLPALRKALGNITNSKAGMVGGGMEGGAVPGKTPGGVRRALGDITNSNAAAPSAQKTAQKPLAVRLAPTLQQQQPSTAAAMAAPPTSRADLLAMGGVERQAGQGWEQLEAGRVAREEAEIQRRLASLANYPTRALPNFFPLWVSGEHACMGATLTSACGSLLTCMRLPKLAVSCRVRLLIRPRLCFRKTCCPLHPHPPWPSGPWQ